MTYKKLELPHVRHDLVGALEDLANKERQLREWPNSNYPHAFWDSIRMATEVILYDVFLGEVQPEKQIGAKLYNEEEAKAIIPVIKLINRVYNEVGEEQPDSVYINSPLWEKVIRAAQNAYDVMISNEPLNSYILECHKHNWDSTNWPLESREEAYYRAYPEEKEREEQEAREEKEKNVTK